MQTRIYAIYDMKAECYNQPFFMHTNGQAIRAFTQEANNPDSFIGKFPNDYVLYELGTFNDAQARFELLEQPKPLGHASEYVNRGQAA